MLGWFFLSLNCIQKWIIRHFIWGTPFFNVYSFSFVVKVITEVSCNLLIFKDYLSFSTSIILPSKFVVLFEKNGLQISQIFLEDAPCDTCLCKNYVLTFLFRLTTWILCFLYVIISALFEISALFFKADRFIIAFPRLLVIKDFRFPWITFVLRGACLFNVFTKNFSYSV